MKRANDVFSGPSSLGKLSGNSNPLNELAPSINEFRSQSKICKKCNEVKELSSFHLVSQNSDGRSGKCRACENKRRMELWHARRRAAGDHIIPRKLFDMTTLEGTRAAWALSNLRPLSAKENIAKGAKVLSLL